MIARGRIAVSGANGFIGRYLCNHLLAQNYEVLAIARRHPMPNIAGRIDVSSDLTNSGSIGVALNGCEAVIHLAGRAHVLSEAASDPLSEFRKANVDATLSLLQSAVQSGVKRFVFVSSIGVNGNRTHGQAFIETIRENPQDLYAVSKLEAEHQLRNYAQEKGIEFVIIRPTLVFGPDAPGNFALLLKLASKNLPLPFGAFSAQRNLISVWNLVDLLYRCALHPEANGQVFLAADEDALTLKDIFTHLRAGMKRRQWIFDFPPAWMSKIASITGKIERFEKLSAELRVDSSKVRNMLDWQGPYTAYEALERTGREYVKSKK